MPVELKKVFDTLWEAPASVRIMSTEWCINLMSYELDQAYRRYKNDIKWFQLFLNGDWLEREIKRLNPDYLDFIEDNHGILGNQKRGNYIPDFEHKENGLRIFTVDTKTFITVDSFNAATKFENADFCLAFIMTESKFYFRKKINGSIYTDAIPMSNISDDLLNTLGKIKLPNIVRMINFSTDKDLITADIPKSVTYTTKEYKVEKGSN